MKWLMRRTARPEFLAGVALSNCFTKLQVACCTQRKKVLCFGQCGLASWWQCHSSGGGWCAAAYSFFSDSRSDICSCNELPLMISVIKFTWSGDSLAPANTTYAQKTNAVSCECSACVRACVRAISPPIGLHSARRKEHEQPHWFWMLQPRTPHAHPLSYSPN